MTKEIRGKAIYFYDEDGTELMHMDFSTDECIWFFESNKKIKVTPDMELHSLLTDFMNNDYLFYQSHLQSSKNGDSLAWFSDCYYNPDDEWSVASVSCLHIQECNGSFDIWCTKELDNMIDRADKSHCICFSPCGNGIYNKNLNTGSTLQSDFVTHIYQPLMFRAKQKQKK